jgi:hypothetical protein
MRRLEPLERRRVAAGVLATGHSVEGNPTCLGRLSPLSPARFAQPGVDPMRLRKIGGRWLIVNEAEITED